MKDVTIIGSGPAGLFAALELIRRRPQSRVVIFEKGPDRKTRTEDNLISGLGGSGAFSDGKLTFPNPKYPRSLEVGGQLVLIIGRERYLQILRKVNRLYTEFGGRPDFYEEGKDQKIQELVEKAFNFKLGLIPTKVRHFGSDLSPLIIKNIREELEKKGVEIFLETAVETIKKDGTTFLLELSGKQTGFFRTRFVVAAPGRGGASWLARQAKTLNIEVQPRQTSVDIGIRVETRSHVLAPLTDYLYDPKIEFYAKPFENKTRTFCVCPYGSVIVEKYQNLFTTVNGHSLFEKHLSKNTNFAMLVSVNFTEPFDEPLKYGGRVSELANMLGGKVLVQRLGDLRAGRRSNPEKINRGLVEPTLKEATPGDLSFALPYRHLANLLGTLEALDNIAPGINGDNTLLYGNEVKFYSSRVKCSSELEAMRNFFVAGDGAGFTRGLLQSSASGIVAAEAILKRMSYWKEGPHE